MCAHWVKKKQKAYLLPPVFKHSTANFNKIAYVLSFFPAFQQIQTSFKELFDRVDFILKLVTRLLWIQIRFSMTETKDYEEGVSVGAICMKWVLLNIWWCCKNGKFSRSRSGQLSQLQGKGHYWHICVCYCQCHSFPCIINFNTFLNTYTRIKFLLLLTFCAQY